ncbi:MAG: UTP--glucose-1-phosphate uridylyltransferase [Propionibacteriaceae bacterium]
MSEQGLAAAVTKMRDAGVNETAIKVFAHLYGEVEAGATGTIPEASIRPVVDPAAFTPTGKVSDSDLEALSKTVIIKLNGGLGTSMGLDAAKTLLPVREGVSFLDIIVRQILDARERYGVRLPLIFMNSFRTDADTLAALAPYEQLAVDDLPLSFIQSQEPKLTADTLEPVSWPQDPSLEWCPPGHGELFSALVSTGLLDQLIAQGYRFASVSNGDNLGAAPDPEMAGAVATSAAPFIAEVCRRTPNDRKGGHVAVRKADDHLILRDLAMTDPQDLEYFEDIELHAYFNTNNLWFDLHALKELLERNDGFLPLPLIRNLKTVDPTQPESTPVIQIESGMGTAIELFDGGLALEVPRDRFLPVKTTNELLLVRSDIFDLGPDWRLRARRDQLPEITLAAQYYKTMADFEQRVPVAPSLIGVDSLTVAGDWTFALGVVLNGDVVLPQTQQAETLPA